MADYADYSAAIQGERRRKGLATKGFREISCRCALFECLGCGLGTVNMDVHAIICMHNREHRRRVAEAEEQLRRLEGQ